MAVFNLVVFVGILLVGTLHFTDGLVKLEVARQSEKPWPITLKCKYEVGKSVKVISLILSKLDGDSREAVTDLVSITRFAPDTVNEISLTGAQAFGRINNDTESILSLQWKTPLETIVGQYRCEANVFEDGSKKVQTTESELASITFPARQDRAVSQEDETGSDDQTSRAAVNTSGMSEVQRLINKVIDLQLQTSQLSQRVPDKEAMKQLLFDQSAEYSGSNYLVSATSWRSVDVAESVCRSFQGYLVEINDAGELAFLGNFLQNSKAANASQFLVGATDFENGGYWQFRYSLDPVSYFDWLPGEPSTRDNDCMILELAGQVPKMADMPCNNNERTEDRRYICEVPVETPVQDCSISQFCN